MVVRVRRVPLPGNALTQRYARGAGYADCYVTRVARPVSQAQFVAAFYTTWLFKLERVILSALVHKLSTDAEAGALARGEREQFAAWTVEARAPDQLLMRDFRGATRSWLMVQPDGDGTALYFGSVVTPTARRRDGRKTMSLTFRALLGFHEIYSRALLRAARARLLRA